MGDVRKGSPAVRPREHSRPGHPTSAIFDRSSADWPGYVAWSGLTQRGELVSLDGMLCPTAFAELAREDWEHNAHEDFETDLFLDVEHVLRRVDAANFNVLALVKEPSGEDIAAFHDPRFAFCGFDIVDSRGGVSLLVNCSPVDRAFSGAELSALGLLTDLPRANDVRDALAREYPDNHHARDAEVWALWRWRGSNDAKK